MLRDLDGNHKLHLAVAVIPKFLTAYIFFHHASDACNKFSRTTVGMINKDQSASLILKSRFWDPCITNFLIPGPGVEKSIPGLQSLQIINKCTKH